MILLHRWFWSAKSCVSTTHVQELQHSVTAPKICCLNPALPLHTKAPPTLQPTPQLMVSLFLMFFLICTSPRLCCAKAHPAGHGEAETLPSPGWAFLAPLFPSLSFLFPPPPSFCRTGGTSLAQDDNGNLSLQGWDVTQGAAPGTPGPDWEFQCISTLEVNYGQSPKKALNPCDQV